MIVEVVYWHDDDESNWATQIWDIDTDRKIGTDIAIGGFLYGWQLDDRYNQRKISNRPAWINTAHIHLLIDLEPKR